MFERQCTLLEKEGNIENSLGQVDLRILYDDDVFGARIVAYSGKPNQLLSFHHRVHHIYANSTNLTMSEITKLYFFRK